jgi:hypothetical protein
MASVGTTAIASAAGIKAESSETAIPVKAAVAATGQVNAMAAGRLED